MLFNVPRHGAPSRSHEGRKQALYAFMVTFDDLAIHPGLHGVVEKPFPEVPQVLEMEVLGEDARIIKAPYPFEGNVLHKSATAVPQSYDLAFWFDRPYHAVTFGIQAPILKWAYEVHVFDRKGGVSTGSLRGSISSAGEHVLSLSADTLTGRPETFQGFTLMVKNYQLDPDFHIEFDLDNLVAI